MARAYIYDMVDTWNAGATTFTAIKMNVTDTASAAGSLLMDLQVNGASQFYLYKTGVGAATSEWQARIWAKSALYVGSAADISLFRDAANTLAQRNGVNAQTFRVYNTYTDASNYERAELRWSANNFDIVTAAGGTGSGRQLRFGVAGAAQWAIDGNLLAVTDNTRDIGASGANRPRTGYFGTSLVAPTLSATSVLYVGPAQEVGLIAEGSNTLAQRSGVSAQTLRVYNTFTDASNYERGALLWSANDLRIQTEKAGTGTARALILGTDASARWVIGATTGHFLAGADSTYDIGAVSTNRPRNIYAAGQTDIAGLSGSITAVAVPAGGTQALRMTTTSALGVYVGSGAPTVSAAKGSLYLRTDGSTTNDRMYVNTNGSTTWTAVTTAA